MSKQTLFLIIILFIFTLTLSYLAFESYNNPIRTSPELISPTAALIPNTPSTSLLFGDLLLTFDSRSATVSGVTDGVSNVFNAYSLPIIINTGENNVSIVQLEISYDPNIINNMTVNPSGFFENPSIYISQIDQEDGRISYALGQSPGSTKSATTSTNQIAKNGKGTVATLSFQSSYKLTEIENTNTATGSATPIPLGSTSVTFLPKTFVVSIGLEESALASTNSAIFNFSN